MAEFNEKNVRKWMKNNLEDSMENGEINCTLLAERAADAFDRAEEGDCLDDPDHWIWDLALEVAHG